MLGEVYRRLNAVKSYCQKDQVLRGEEVYLNAIHSWMRLKFMDNIPSTNGMHHIDTYDLLV